MSRTKTETIVVAKPAKPNKRAAVRECMGALGNKADNTAIQKRLLGMGIEMPLGMISSYKSGILGESKPAKRQKAVAATPVRERGTNGSQPHVTRARSQPATNGSGLISVDDVETIRTIAARVGAPVVQRVAGAV